MNKVYLFLFLILGAIVRLVALDQFPPAMLQDEAALGYNAILIANTGKDEWGETMPISFKSFGDYKPPVYVYVTALIYKIIGWTPILPRLASAFSGIGSIYVLYLWIKAITKSKKLSLFGAFLFASSPWTIHLSRMGLESNLGMFFFISGMMTYQLAVSKHKLSYSFGSVLFFTLSAYTFHSFRFIVLGYLFSLIALSAIKQLYPKLKIIIPGKEKIIITSCSLLLILPGLVSTQGLARFNQTSLAKPDALENIFDFNRNSCHVLSIDTNHPIIRQVCALIWNKYTIPVQIYYTSFLRHISPNFIFFYGDETFNRNPIKSGEMYVYLLPIFLYGVFLSLKNPKYWRYIIGFLIAMIPAVLTGPPHSTRLSAQIPFIVMLIVIGYKQIAKKWSPITPILYIAITLSTSFFVLRYAISTHANSQEFLGQSRQVSQKIYEYWQNGYTVYVDQDTLSEPQIFFLYWNNIDPKVYFSLEKRVVTDASGFTRIVQLGDRLFFEGGEVSKLFCAKNDVGKVVYITNKDIAYPPDFSISSYSGVYKLASFYDIGKINTSSCKLPNSKN